MYSVRALIGLAVCLFLCPPPVSGQQDELAEKVRLAQDLVRAGRYVEAIPIYRGLMDILPDNPSLLTNLGFALHMSGRHREAARHFADALKIDPGYVQARLYLGAANLSLAEPAKAIEALEKVVHAQPDNKDARQLLGEAFLSVRQFDEAAQEFERLCELDSMNPQGWSGLGRSYEGQARKTFEELEKVAPESGYWLELVAESRFNQQQFEYAFFFYREALAKMPSLRGVHAALAEIYRKTGRPDWAAVEEERERKLQPLNCSPPDEVPVAAQAGEGSGPASRLFQRRHGNDRKLECDFWAGHYRELIASPEDTKTADSYFWRSRAYSQLAAEAFDRLFQLPPSAEVHKLKAKIFFLRRQYSEAASEWQEAAKLSPGNPYVQKELAVSLNMSGDHDGAQHLLEDLVKRIPESAELNYLLGDTFLRQQKGEQAIPYLHKAVDSAPTMLEAHRELGRAYSQAGQAEMAIPHLKAALPIDKDGSLYYQLAQAYRSIGQSELSKEMLQKFQEVRQSVEADRQNTDQKIQITPP